MANLLGTYINGNYSVSLFDDGTKIRENNLESLSPSTVESIDIKITNRCDMGCGYCHEDSRPNGKHGDILSDSFISKLHSYTELAIGGGNPLCHPDLMEFLDICQGLHLIPSITINQLHFEREYAKVCELVNKGMIYGIGISLVNPTNEFISKVKRFPNAVIHVIAGIATIEALEKLKDNGLKILILGYKTFRRGVEYKGKYGHDVIERLVGLHNKLPYIISERWFEAVSFDNLSIPQLDVKRLLDEDEWSRFYMGDDGFASMYVDMVERKFALNSCEPLNRRYELLPTIEDMFEYLRKEEKNGA